ncbi:MAG: hypothetical protein WEC59_04135 [Salibacteraceae bacterium]
MKLNTKHISVFLLGFFVMAGSAFAQQFDRRTFNQYGAELLYRFGAGEDFYIGGRYNLVDGETANGNIEIDRFNIGSGWFLTKNVLAKLEYVTQNFEGEGYSGTKYENGKFNGIMVEAVISF